MAANHLRILSRGLSTSSSVSQLVKTPIQVHGTEGRYAAALYSAATKQKALDAVEKDLKTFGEALKKDTRFHEFMADPSVKKQLKTEGLTGACDKLKMNPLSKNLFVCLAENGRYNSFESVISTFSTIMSAHRGEVVCEVTTAKALDAAMTKEVEAALNSFLKKGEKSFIKYHVDPSIIGGMIVSIGDKYVDMSMSAKLHKYTDIIKSAA